MDDETKETKEDIQDQKEIAEEKEEKIEELEEEISKLKDKDQNFSKLKEKKNSEIEKLQKEKEEAKSKIGSLEETLNEKIEKVRDEFASDKLWSEINKRAGGDEELAEKIKEHYDSFRGDPETEEEKQERLDNAETLATGGKKESLSSNVVRSGIGKPQTEHKPPKIKPEVKQFAKEKLGLDDEDFGDKDE